MARDGPIVYKYTMEDSFFSDREMNFSYDAHNRLTEVSSRQENIGHGDHLVKTYGSPILVLQV